MAGILRSALILAAVGLISACAGKPFEYRPQNEIPAGPGMLTGPEGAFVLHRTTAETAAPADAKPAQLSTEVNARSSEHFREFEAYRDYLRAKEERTAEYREFLEWLEWKAYRAQKDGPAPR
jgi:hypothetical protein